MSALIFYFLPTGHISFGAAGLNDGAEILVRKDGGAPVSALAWNAGGTMLAYAAEDGDAGLLEL